MHHGRAMSLRVFPVACGLPRLVACGLLRLVACALLAGPACTDTEGTTEGTQLTGGTQTAATGGDVSVTGGTQTVATGGDIPVTGGMQTATTGGDISVTGGTQPAATGGDIPATGGTQTGGNGPATGGMVGGAAPRMISVDDAAPGFASIAGGTTGGGTDLNAAIAVSTMSELRSAVAGSSPALILVRPGSYVGELSPGANKTIVGVGPGAKILGNLKISGSDRSNIIVRNIAVQGEKCLSYEACKSGADAVYVGNGAHHVWLDHLDVSDGQDGNCDITQGGNYVTVSWTHFHYTYDKEHRYSNLIAGSDDEPASVGKLRITYMNSYWGARVDQRQPRGRFGNIHMLNNYHDTSGSQIHGVGKDMALIAENSVYNEGISIWKDMGSPRGWRGIGNIGSGLDLGDSRGTVFEIPYDYSAMPASEVVAAVTSSECGAGNTCELAQ